MAVRPETSDRGGTHDPYCNRQALSPGAARRLAAMPLPARRHDNTFKAQLDGYQEVPRRFPPGTRRFRATYDKGSATLSYELSYDDIDPTQAHITWAEGTNGGISLFLCSNLPNPSWHATVPPGPATVSGSLQGRMSSSRGQGIAPRARRVLDAMREGAATSTCTRSPSRRRSARAGQVTARRRTRVVTGPPLPRGRCFLLACCACAPPARSVNGRRIRTCRSHARGERAWTISWNRCVSAGRTGRFRTARAGGRATSSC